jgi:predicted nuclease of predicted toxin-antitoxin system
MRSSHRARALANGGGMSVPSAHVADCGLLNASDAAIWDFAAETGAVLMTKDGDFAVRRVVAVGPPPVVWLRFPNKRTPELLDYLAGILPFIVVELEQGDLLVEVR